jgi:hypothetical protein
MYAHSQGRRVPAIVQTPSDAFNESDIIDGHCERRHTQEQTAPPSVAL